MTHRWGKVAALAATVGLSWASLAWWASAGAGSVTSPSGFPDGGFLRLHMDAAGTFFEADKPVGNTYAVDKVQPITVKGSCNVSLASSPALATLSALGDRSPTVGFVDNGLGVCSQGEGSGQPAGRVDAGFHQALVLNLGTGLAGRLIDEAELDIEAKFRGIVKADLGRAGTLVATVTLDTSTAPDSNPDAGARDNIRWQIAGTPLFDSITLRADSGAFDLEAGADGTAPGPLGHTALNDTRDSLFHLVQGGTLNCGDTASVGSTVGQPTAAVTRQANADGSTCVRVIYFLRTDVGTVQFSKDLSAQPKATFKTTITWAPENATYPVNRVTTIDTLDGTGPHPAAWCGGTADAPTVADGHWCLTGQSSTLVGGGQIQVTESFFGQGDPVWSRV